MPALAQGHQREAEQDREQQHLKDVAAREGADDTVGNDVENEVDRMLCLGLFHEVRHGAGIGLRRDAAPDRHEVADDEADDQGEGRDDLEIDQRLDRDAADLLGLLDMRDAGNDRAEDDRRDDHLDELDEAVTQRLDPVVLSRRPGTASR